ncbi:MAG TPA: ornithine cyclodeaminase family protein [Thermoanaerobaculia bacterium]|jgi:ornithine cyclodeaminase|nr:ornithine cyclodeaminase family protein [Thermoanaerobaculia bacterium]
MSRLLILNEHEVHELLTMRECISVMEEALANLARGEGHNPLRSIVRAPGASGFLGLMPAYGTAGAKSYYALKEICLFPGNPARGLDTHLGAVLLHSGETGELLAAANASAITAIRTAAVSAVATKLLARENASTLAILGAGVQAKSHLEAIPLVRDIGSIRICSRSRAKAEALAGTDKRVKVIESVQEAVDGADIIVTATSSKEPVLRREWLSDGVHINAVGSSVATSRELDSATMAAAALFVDRRESTVNESGDYLMALREGAIREGHIRAEIGEILLGKAKGRLSDDEITLFKSLGIAVEDLASVAFLYDKARARSSGSWLEF